MAKFFLKPINNRVIVEPIEEVSGIIIMPLKNQMWRGRIVRSETDEFQTGDIIRFQPMKRRTDAFRYEDKTYISLPKDWIYLKEKEDGTPIETYGNRFVVSMLEQQFYRRIVIESFDNTYNRAEVICSGKWPKLDVGSTVIVDKSDYWQFYRVGLKWYFVCHASMILADENMKETVVL